MKEMMAYYLHDRYGNYKAIYHYHSDVINESEVFARQLCDFFVKDNKTYKLIENELIKEGAENYDALIVEEVTDRYNDENHPSYGDGVHLEFREFNRYSNDIPLLEKIELQNHIEAIRYLLKDIIPLGEKGTWYRDSAEIDEDRSTYVIYVQPTE